MVAETGNHKKNLGATNILNIVNVFCEHADGYLDFFSYT